MTAGDEHDGLCEAEWESGAMAYTPCACGVRAEIPADVHEWLAETYRPEGVEIWLRGYVNGDDAHREHLIAVSRMDGNGT